MNEVEYRVFLKRNIRNLISNNKTLKEKYNNLDINEIDTRILELILDSFKEGGK